MTLTLELPAALAQQLESCSDTERELLAQNALAVGAAFNARPLTAREVLALPADVRARLIEAQAEAMAPYYEADLALPPHERELTAMSSFYDPLYEYPEETPRTLPSIRGGARFGM